MQKEEHNEAHQQDRVAKRLHHLENRIGDEGRGVVAERVGEPVGKPASQFRHLRSDCLRAFQRVGAGELEDRNRHAGLTAVPADLIVGLGPQLDPSHVAQPHQRRARSGCISLENDFAELLRGLQATKRRHHQLRLLVGADRRLARDATDYLQILLGDNLRDIVG